MADGWVIECCSLVIADEIRVILCEAICREVMMCKQ